MPWQPNGITLTDHQQKAVYHGEGPILVVAGAGTGKTTVLASRVVRLIEDGLAAPSEILAVTYTRNSARDLLKRIARIWKGSEDPATVAKIASTGLKATTFHSYCYGLLRGAGQRFDLIDDKDLYVMLRRNIDELGLQYYIKAASPGEFLYGLNGFFQRCHDELRTPADYDAYVEKVESGAIALPRVSQARNAADMPKEEIIGRCREIARVFHYVEDKLKNENLGTYSHLITRTVDMLRDPAQAAQLKKARTGAKFLLVDEFQDSNVAQIELARLLAGTSANVFAVGDPDQAIYRFRGATTGTFDHFLRIFGVENVERVTMAENRRSVEPVLKAAYEVISQNPEITRIDLPGGAKWQRVPLQHKRTKLEPDPVSPVLVRAWETKQDEASFVTSEIERMHTHGNRPWKDFAVIYHNHRHRNEVVWDLSRRAIPFAVVGLDLLEVPEVRDLMAALLAMEGTDAVALLRVAALGHFAVDGLALRSNLQSQGDNNDLESVLEKVVGGMQVVTALKEARSDLQRAGSKAFEACEIAVRQFGIERSADIEGFLKFVKTWTDKPKQVSQDGTLPQFLEYVKFFEEAGGRISKPEETGDDGTPAALQMELGDARRAAEPEDAVRLLTAHAAKGLEFPVVFVLRLTQPSFPGKYREDLVEYPNAMRDLDSRLPEDPKQIHSEEELRLFYVAITRAEDQLYLCAKKGRGKDDTPPGYLRNLLTATRKNAPGSVAFALIPNAVARPQTEGRGPAPAGIQRWLALEPSGNTRKPTLSAGAIQDYENCPLKYKLSQEWKLREEPGANIYFGWAMHAALLAYFDSVRKGRPMAAGEVVAYFHAEFDDKPIADATQKRLYSQDGERQLYAFLASPSAQPKGKVAFLEHWFSFESGGVRVVGRIDRVDEDDDGYVVVDYKTGQPKSQDTADKSVQLSIYALALAEKKPVKMLLFQNMEDNSATVTTRSAEELQETAAQITDVAAGIAAGKFAAKIGRHCDWCAYRMICPQQEAGLSPSAAESREE